MANYLFYALTGLSFLMLFGLKRRFSQDKSTQSFKGLNKHKEKSPSFFDFACIVVTAACITAAFFAFRYSSF